MKKLSVLSATLFLAVNGLGAQTTVTPSNLQGWNSNSLAGSGAVGITGTQGRSVNGSAGNGSLELTGTGSADRTRYTISSGESGGFGLLNQLSQLSFDWYRASTATPAAAHHAPVFRMIVADPGAQTPITYREIIWEYEYQFPSGGNVAPTNAWQDDVNLLAANWYTNPALAALGAPCPSAYNCLNQAENWGFSSSAYVYGFSIGTGSGWAGNFTGFADDVTFRFGDGPATRYDFETSSTVPEPNTLTLLVAGGLALVAMRRRLA